MKHWVIKIMDFEKRHFCVSKALNMSMYKMLVLEDDV